ncbi:hypothetical protein NDU88_005281 [Pleurodeles waltl]|uniref:Uncharacterized protein n=1 Tax=Pleurodeles waltl TaxID=8319 RepID=A0AAV7PN73_PLEWA|nr:hypothetical protein NDU88_005281 [Pleurodeles waltl]
MLLLPSAPIGLGGGGGPRDNELDGAACPERPKEKKRVLARARGDAVKQQVKANWALKSGGPQEEELVLAQVRGGDVRHRGYGRSLPPSGHWRGGCLL